ncbi:MAG: polysaccharide deacetylase family protein [Rhodospirillaceae bacterium]|nr:polysaccharide deacetylase family protein [Rhodospirillaceae bacterium]MDD9999213.1 polysaccharide deacetylase family protein [Rhodospirillaceae bacterium]MDE0362195.1 polysaccharide deacetylase family protein [Rhodospirillaceae bacterium]
MPIAHRLPAMVLIVAAATACGGSIRAQEPDPVDRRTPWTLSIDEVRVQALQFSPGRSFWPAKWPGGARVGILISFDVDNESLAIIDDADPFIDSLYQFGTQRGLPRILNVLDRHDVPATFFVPAVTLQLTPAIAASINASGRHEFAAHGWIHERASDLTPEEHEHYLRRAVDEITRLTGTRPVGYRAPYGIVTADTIRLLQELDFVYHSGFVADDVPYELLSDGRPTGLVELPPSLGLEDSLIDPLNSFSAGIQSPGDTLESFKSAFDVAYREGGMVLVLMHPHVTGTLSRISVLEGLIEYARSYDEVWFGTHRAAAEHFREVLADSDDTPDGGDDAARPNDN